MSKGRYVSHPGVYIKEAIEELGLNQSEFALRAGLTPKNVSTIISGESDITFDAAVKIAAFFHNEVEGWINLQTKYDMYRREEEKEKEIEADWEIAKRFDKAYIKGLSGIDIDAKDKEASVENLRRLFNVGPLQALKRPDLYVFYKTSVNKGLDETSIIMRNAWISIAESRARGIKANSFNKESVLENLGLLKSLTLKGPNDFEAALHQILNEAGIKLVILPYLPKSNVNGITKWINHENNVLLAVNDCGKDAARFWFALFHELGHAVKNHKRHLTISYAKNEIDNEEEKQANEFANNALIDKNDYAGFIEKGHFDYPSIRAFAEKERIADFIVIGRLQKDGYLGWNAYSDKKIKYEADF